MTKENKEKLEIQEKNEEEKILDRTSIYRYPYNMCFDTDNLSKSMICIFEDINCPYSNDSHDNCRHCRNVPIMLFESKSEMRYLCSIAGQRDKQKEEFGIEFGEDPKWLEKILKKYKGQTGIENCIDHRRTLNQVLISEPYDLDMEDFRKLIKFCDENNLRFRVDGNSAHFPGRCFRILITKNKNKKQEKSK